MVAASVAVPASVGVGVDELQHKSVVESIIWNQAVCGLIHVTSGRLIGGVRTVRLVTGPDGRFRVIIEVPNIAGVGYMGVGWRCVRLKDLGDNPKFASSEFFEVTASPGQTRAANLAVPITGTAVNCYWAGFSGTFGPPGSDSAQSQAFMGAAFDARDQDFISARSVGGSDMTSYAHCVRTTRNPVRRKWRFTPNQQASAYPRGASIGFPASSGFCNIFGVQTVGGEDHELVTKLVERVNPDNAETEWHLLSGPERSIFNCQKF